MTSLINLTSVKSSVTLRFNLKFTGWKGKHFDHLNASEPKEYIALQLNS